MTYDVSSPVSWDRLPDGDAPDDYASAHDFVAAFRFVQSLAAELSRGRVSVPAAPGVSRRLVRALERDDLSDSVVTRLVTAEAGLAVKLLELANGRAHGEGPANNFKLAIARMGREKLRTVTLPYLMRHVQSDEAYGAIRDDLVRLWERSIRVAAIARVLARTTRAATPDLAMVAGLLHNVGSVYMLARARPDFALFSKPAIYDVMLNDWQAQLSKAIAQNWGLPEPIVDALGEQDTFEREDTDEAELSDVLHVAVIASAYEGQADELEIALADEPSFQRLGLGHATLRAALRESAAELAALRSALGE